MMPGLCGRATKRRKLIYTTDSLIVWLALKAGQMPSLTLRPESLVCAQEKVNG